MPQQSTEQQKSVGRVMHESKHGALESRSGDKVRNPKQAVAIALSEAGSFNQESPEANRSHLARTKTKERHGETAQQQKEGTTTMDRGKICVALYQEVARRGIKGRSRMIREELSAALRLR